MSVEYDSSLELAGDAVDDGVLGFISLWFRVNKFQIQLMSLLAAVAVDLSASYRIQSISHFNSSEFEGEFN